MARRRRAQTSELDGSTQTLTHTHAQTYTGLHTHNGAHLPPRERPRATQRVGGGRRRFRGSNGGSGVGGSQQQARVRACARVFSRRSSARAAAKLAGWLRSRLQPAHLALTDDKFTSTTGPPSSAVVIQMRLIISLARRRALSTHAERVRARAKRTSCKQVGIQPRRLADVAQAIDRLQTSAPEQPTHQRGKAFDCNRLLADRIIDHCFATSRERRAWRRASTRRAALRPRRYR